LQRSHKRITVVFAIAAGDGLAIDNKSLLSLLCVTTEYYCTTNVIFNLKLYPVVPRRAAGDLGRYEVNKFILPKGGSRHEENIDSFFNFYGSDAIC
jgi:hypothetical protein